MSAINSGQRRAPGWFIRCGGWKRWLLGLVGLTLVAVSALWIASLHASLRRDWSLGDYTGSIVAAGGQIQIDIFRNIAEDDFYQHAAVSFPGLEIALAATAAGLCWWTHHDRQRATARGFEIPEPPASACHPTKTATATNP